MAIKKRLAAHNPQAALNDSHVRFALRHAISAQKRQIESAEEFGETEAQLQGEYERLTYFERLLKQEDLLRVES